MFFWVLLNCKKKILVPIEHCEINNICDFFNGGAIGKQIPKLFFSSNKKSDVNFDMEISQSFDENIDACYSGKILKCFGKF